MITEIEQVKTLVAGLGEIQISGDPEMTLSCLGLGSCVALCMYDPVVKVGGMAHIVLPSSKRKTKNSSMETKYADVAIIRLLDLMREYGAVRARLVVKMAGGAQRLLPGNNENVFNTGQNNIEAVEKVLADEAITVAAADIGGNKGRSAKLFIGTGKFMVKSIGEEEKEL